MGSHLTQEKSNRLLQWEGCLAWHPVHRYHLVNVSHSPMNLCAFPSSSNRLLYLSLCFPEQKQFWSRFSHPPRSFAMLKSEECVVQAFQIAQKVHLFFHRSMTFCKPGILSELDSTMWDFFLPPPGGLSWALNWLNLGQITFWCIIVAIFDSYFVRQPLLKAIVQL